MIQLDLFWFSIMIIEMLIYCKKSLLFIKTWKFQCWSNLRFKITLVRIRIRSKIKTPKMESPDCHRHCPPPATLGPKPTDCPGKFRHLFTILVLALINSPDMLQSNPCLQYKYFFSVWIKPILPWDSMSIVNIYFSVWIDRYKDGSGICVNIPSFKPHLNNMIDFSTVQSSTDYREPCTVPKEQVQYVQIRTD